MNISDIGNNYKIVSAPSNPPTQGVTNISQLGGNYTSGKQANVQSQSSSVPLLSKQSSDFGSNLLTAGKDVALGAAKGFVQGARGTAGIFQSAGKGILGSFGVDTSKMGFQSVDNSTPAGAQVEQQLHSNSRAEQVGKVLETIGELGAGFATDEGQQLASKAKTGYDAFKEARGAKLAEQEANDVMEVVKPKLTPKLETEAKAAGRGTTQGGLFNRAAINPTESEKQMAQFAHEAGVSSNNTFDKNIQLMKDVQKQSAQDLRAGLKETKGTWNRNDVVGALNSVKSPLTIKSDATLTRLANNFKKAIVDISASINKSTEGLLDLRQGVDDLIDKEFPANVYHKDTPVGQYVRQVRQTLNKMIEDKLPEGKLPNGQSFRGELRRQSLLYDAIENVADKAPKEGESARPVIQKVKGFTKKHPIITGAVSGSAAYGTAKKLGVPLP